MPDLRETEPGWYCFKALPKKEHIAARMLQEVEGIETFCPRIAYLKKTRRGKVRFVECLFPGYIFIHAELKEFYRRIRATQGIRDVVAFGQRVPLIPSAFIEELRARIGDQSTRDMPEPVIEAGQKVIITEGPFKDLQAMVSGSVDSRQRVALLLDFLGRQMEISLSIGDVIPDSRDPKREVWED
jgi:transcriptional antiterminator RfaH